MDNAEWKPNMQDVQEGAYAKKKKSLAGQFAAVKHRSETYCWTQKLKREDYGVDKYLKPKPHTLHKLTDYQPTIDKQSVLTSFTLNWKHFIDKHPELSRLIQLQSKSQSHYQ